MSVKERIRMLRQKASDHAKALGIEAAGVTLHSNQKIDPRGLAMREALSAH